MIICIECTAKTKDDLDDLLQIGGYRDYSEAVALAVSNQILLHRGAKAGKGATSPVIEERPEALRAAAEDATPTAGVNGDRGSPGTAEIPALFRIVDTKARLGTAAALPNDAFMKGQRISIDRWIFGQHNKLLPLKASIRALANVSLDQRGGVPLVKAAGEIALASEILGTYLRRIDQDLGLVREESLSTAFPSAATDINKSRLRFSNQFVGALNKRGQLRGFPIDLKLVNYRNPKDPKLLLTDAGWAFAGLTNPILDRPTDTGEKLSEEERAFLIQHIRDNVPVEDFAIRAVLAALQAGARNPDDLDSALGQHIPERSEEPFSAAFLSTQRAGAISRMTDLGLVVRERQGLRVLYVVSGSGKKYLERATRHEVNDDDEQRSA
jgi:hypothetical protein